MFGKDKDQGKPAGERAEEKRDKLMRVARTAAWGPALTHNDRVEALIAGIYLELCAMRDRVAPAAEPDHTAAA